MFSSVPSHVCFAVIMGLLLWYCYNSNGINKILLLILSCLIPIIVHALYNVFLYKGIASLYIYNLIVLVILELSCIIIVFKSMKE